MNIGNFKISDIQLFLVISIECSGLLASLSERSRQQAIRRSLPDPRSRILDFSCSALLAGDARQTFRINPKLVSHLFTFGTHISVSD